MTAESPFWWASTAPYWWLQPTITAVASLLAILAAWFYANFTIFHQRAIARMRATLDLIEKAESSEPYRKLSITFRNALASKDPNKLVPIDKLMMPETPDEVDQRLKIIFFLNHSELIASGFNHGVLDRSFYADFMRGALVHDWKVAKPFIDELRKPDPGVHPHPATIYEHFEALAKEWDWEIEHEKKLRQQGESPAQIKRAIGLYRLKPHKRPFPPL